MKAYVLIRHIGYHSWWPEMCFLDRKRGEEACEECTANDGYFYWRLEEHELYGEPGHHLFVVSEDQNWSTAVTAVIADEEQAELAAEGLEKAPTNWTYYGTLPEKTYAVWPAAIR